MTSTQNESEISKTDERGRNIDPYSYLRDLLTRLPHLTNYQISEVTLAAWANAQRKLSKAKT